MVLKRAEEQAQIIESLQGTMVVDEMHSLTSARVECARDEADATFAKENLALMMQESEKIAKLQQLQRSSILKRNVELSQSVTDYQHRLRESTQNVQRTEDEARRLLIEVAMQAFQAQTCQGRSALHHSKCVLEIQAPVMSVLKAKGFAALKALDQTIMKDMLHGELWHVKLSRFEPSQFPTSYKDHGT
ncbi:hypothetical protein SELMODRAFT_423307 [Selaginella moellendorffii]|uniref:Uncharacterized protein n=1 Tax=Selaginella moellendorffii TaxID=88036 RepID=D8SL89_SELML|nr:hypothetical protein SELMODRAFT_423307 [Selaginella moellendorffii]